MSGKQQKQLRSEGINKELVLREATEALRKEIINTLCEDTIFKGKYKELLIRQGEAFTANQQAAIEAYGKQQALVAVEQEIANLFTEHLPGLNIDRLQAKKLELPPEKKLILS